MPDPEQRAAEVLAASLFDPGRYIERVFTPSDYGGTNAEPLHSWQTRAIPVALAEAGLAITDQEYEKVPIPPCECGLAPGEPCDQCENPGPAREVREPPEG